MNTKVVTLVVVLVAVFSGGWYLLNQQEKRQGNTVADAEGHNQLVIYSGRKEALILPIIQSFEEESGIDVILKYGSTEELAHVLLQEGAQSQADVYISTDASLLQELAIKGMFTPIISEFLSKIPQKYRASDGLWTGVSGRARVLIVNTDMLSESEYPDSIYDITDELWQGKVAMAKMTNESVVTHMSAIRTLRGDDFIVDFLQGIKNNNVTLLSGHTAVRQAVARGEFPIGLVNHYYGHLQQQDSDNIAILYTDQESDLDGSFVNVSGVGILAAGDNTGGAQKFVHYLLTQSAQKQFAELNYEFPLIKGITSENTKNLGEFKEMDVDLHEVATKRQETLNLIKSQGL